MVSLHDVSAVIAEMAPVCVGGLIRNIRQLTPDTITIALRRPQRSVAILISAHPRYGRLHILRKPISGLPTPPPFCQYMRAHLLGATMRRMVQMPHDRIVWLELKHHDNTFFLVAALTGRSANLFILDSQGAILRSLKPEKYGGRSAGRVFEPPPVPSGNTTPESVRTDSSRFHAEDEGSFPVSRRIETACLEAEQHENRAAERRQHASRLRNNVRKLQRRIERLAGDLDRVLPYREYQRYGELLKNHLSALSPKQDCIKVIDYFDDTLPVIVLPLDRQKNGPENLADYFKKYRKFVGAQTNLAPRLEEAKKTLAELQLALREAEHGRMPPSAVSKAGAHARISPNAPQRPASKTASACRSFRSHDGYAILVGKNARGNDVLTFTMSKPDDLWLHANGVSGSHVIVRLPKKRQTPPETLQDAAALAVLYSNLRKSGKGEIIYALKKYVKKPKGARPGSATVTRGKTMWVSVDQARLERLKESDRTPS